ncbi:short chain dehydrogenase [Aspergillus bertholletiae]|uniref:Short chain dehydrogenase n=1 Tax=Aspergillus bertholletiae TaxID=1226010 RepID=A0A5N7BI93_9EURO|nr:short chain dehydrogenase [Aspergillus bertholletiae]
MCSNRVNFRPDHDIPDLSGQVIIVTGGNSGLGFETIKQLAKHNPAHIYLAARSSEKAERAIHDLRKLDGVTAPISHLPLDLSSFESIKDAVAKFHQSESRLDTLINNAGIMMVAEGLTEEGYEIQFGTNVMGHALLTKLLLPIIQQTAQINPEARVVTLSSASEAMAPSDIYKFNELKTTMSDRSTQARYCISKIGNAHYSAAMARHCTDVKFVCVHPGMVDTNLHVQSSGVFLRAFLYTAIYLFATPLDKGAHSQIWASVSPDAKSGEFYAPVGQPGKGSKRSRSEELSETLFHWIQEELRRHL